MALYPLVRALAELTEAELPVGTLHKRKGGIFKKIKSGLWKLVPGKQAASGEPDKKAEPRKVEPPKTEPPKQQAAVAYKKPKPGHVPAVGELAPIKPGRQWIKYSPDLPKNTLSAHTDKNGQLTPERQKLHDSIVSHFMDSVPSVPKDKKPVAIMLMGGPASGKSTLTQGMDMSNFVQVDADKVKEMLPEYQHAISKNARNAAEMVHSESSKIASRLKDEVLKQRKNIVMDETGKFAGSFLDRAHGFKNAGYNVSVMMPFIPPDKAVERSHKRAEETGRWIDPDIVQSTTRAAASNFHGVAADKALDKVVLLDNSGTEPRVVHSSEHGKGVDHDPEFMANFRKKNARPRPPRSALPPLTPGAHQYAWPSHGAWPPSKHSGSKSSKQTVDSLEYEVRGLLADDQAAPEPKPAVDPAKVLGKLIKNAATNQAAAKANPEPRLFKPDEGIILPEPD